MSQYEDNNIEPDNRGVIEIKKKNRTLQFYKFLFYSIKTELKLQDLIKLFRASSAGEISLWIISLIIYISTPKDFPKLSNLGKSTSYKNIFIWFHIIHIFRGSLGLFLIYNFPRSYQVINNLELNSDSKLEKTLFNDLIRETIFFNVTEKIRPKRKLVIIYVIMTLINLLFDLIDFGLIICSLSSATPEVKVVLLTYLIIAGIYVLIDLSYVIWLEQLKYIFPREYLKPIESIYFGIVEKALIKFKLRKPKTDIISEANAQNSGQAYAKSNNDMGNGGVNVLENILKDSLGVKFKEDSFNSNEGKKNDNRQIYPNISNNPPNSEDQLNEQKLDS